MSTSNDTEQQETKKPTYAEVLAVWLIRIPFGVPALIVLSLFVLAAGTYICWWFVLPLIVLWSNEIVWRWLIGWLGVLLSACGPVYILMGIGPVILATLNVAGNREEKRELDELDLVEQEIRGSDDPVDYARYSRKALRAYYLMGQNQVRLSFYVGVAAMIFGFLFLVTGLIVQTLDITALPFLRKDLNVNVIAVGGGLIIEFIAATFLWIYRAAIVQLNLYYRRQMLIHSALLSVAVAQKMGKDVDLALQSIIATLVMPTSDGHIPEPVKPRASRPPRKNSSSSLLNVVEPDVSVDAAR